jgi:hypothetical protein
LTTIRHQPGFKIQETVDVHQESLRPLSTVSTENRSYQKSLMDIGSTNYIQLLIHSDLWAAGYLQNAFSDTRSRTQSCIRRSKASFVVRDRGPIQRAAYAAHNQYNRNYRLKPFFIRRACYEISWRFCMGKSGDNCVRVLIVATAWLSAIHMITINRHRSNQWQAIVSHIPH